VTLGRRDGDALGGFVVASICSRAGPAFVVLFALLAGEAQAGALAPAIIVPPGNIQSMQNAGSNMAAYTSGQVITEAINGALTSFFGGGGGPTSYAAFAPELQFVNRTEEELSALAYAGGRTKAARLPVVRAPMREPEWMVWGDIHYTGWERDTTGRDLRGDQVNLTGGLSRRITRDWLVGLVAGYENIDANSNAVAAGLRGVGGSIGGYSSYRFGALRFDAALTWTGLSYDATAPGQTGSFDADRLIGYVALTGNHYWGAFVVEPSLRLYVAWEWQDQWTDSGNTVRPSQDISVGRFSFGGRLIRPGAWWWHDVTVAPYFGLYGDARFSNDGTVPINATLLGIEDGLSGRVTYGAEFRNSRGFRLALGGEYGGIGADYDIWTLLARGVWPL
jgi:hypothetical protein